MSYVNTQNLQRLTTVVNLVLLTLGSYIGVNLSYQLAGMYIQSPGATEISSQSASSETATISKSIDQYNPIMERDLFKIGKATAAVKSPDVNPDTLAKTQLSLKLWGTVSGDTDQVYAVIEDLQKHEQNLYRVGDTIQNATVKIVMREKVVLNVEGRDEVLAMEDMAGDSDASSLMANRGRPSRSPLPANPVPAVSGGEGGQQNITLQRSMVEESFNDMNKLMTEIAITPNMEDGQPNGLSLNRISPNSIFRRMGLRNGDVLTGVNGAPIQSPEDAMRMYESFKSSAEIQVQVKRRGQERTIVYNLQ